MFMQSAAMALGFGSFFQYGKRKMSAMSNEEFNALTPEELTAQLMSSINNMIPTVEQSFKQMEQMNVMILQAMAKYFDQAIGFLNEWIKGGQAGLVHNIEHGTEQITTGIEDIFKFEGSDIPDFIQTAGGDPLPEETIVDKPILTDTKSLTANEKWATKWFSSSSGSIQGKWDILSLKSITLAELKYLAKIFSKGLLPKASSFKWGTVMSKKLLKLNPKKLTPVELKVKTETAITKSGATGTVKTIAFMWSKLGMLLRMYLKTKINKRKKAFEFYAKQFNQYVASVSQPKLQINAEKSLVRGFLVPK